MHTHGDVFDRPDRVAGSFWGSMGLHVSVAVALMAYAAVSSRKPVMGDVNGGNMGAVAVTAVHTIPLPSRNSAPNPVANPTKSYVPTPPPKAKPQPKVKAPDPKAIAIPDKTAPKKIVRQEAAAPNKFREQQQELPNQVYSTPGQAVSSQMYQIQGAGGLTLGNSNPLGQQFGYYAKLIIDQVGRKWNTSTLNPRIQTAPMAVVTFIINRDGSVPQGSVKISQSSGISLLDLSAQRAVMDASPFPPLPQGFPRNDAQIELHFELRR
jgi:periplasmic protein TonB